MTLDLRPKNWVERFGLFGIAACLIILATSTFSAALINKTQAATFSPAESHSPRVVPQRPLVQRPNTDGDPYWFQTGAIGDSSSYYYTGVNVTIRTVFDKVSEGDHSYWVGALLSNYAFIQVGYLTAVIDNKQYCCSWFYEFFPVGSFNPTIYGPEGSAGPIGSSHTYSMLHTGNGFWTIYMDNKQISPPLDTGATDSGANAPAPTAEVAGAPTNQDILGPAEFKNLVVRQSSGWQQVHSAQTFIYYAAGTRVTRFTPPIPYGVWEVEGKDNDFIAGSGIPQAGPVQPVPGTTLWPTPQAQYANINFSFTDRDQHSFTPDWMSLKANGTWAFYTNYSDQLIPTSPANWTLDSLYLHAVNVAPQGTHFSTPRATNLTIQGNVFTSDLDIFGNLYTIPASGALTLTTFPDSTIIQGNTDSSGQVTLKQLVPGTYTILITVQGGLRSIQSFSITGPGKIILVVFGPGELATIFSLPILATAVVMRRATNQGNRSKSLNSE